MVPSIGRIVHYNGAYDSHAALIIGVSEDGKEVDLQVFYQDGRIARIPKARQGSEPGDWNWPPHV